MGTGMRTILDGCMRDGGTIWRGDSNSNQKWVVKLTVTLRFQITFIFITFKATYRILILHDHLCEAMYHKKCAHVWKIQEMFPETHPARSFAIQQLILCVSE